MRVVLTILLMCCLGCQCFVQLGIFGWYELNKKAITEQFCINKNKPQLHCNGKCHLKKQLQKADDNHSEQQQHNTKQGEWTVFILPSQPLPAAIFPTPGITNYIVQSEDYCFLFSDGLLRPPQTA